MSQYRTTGLLLPAFLLMALPMLAAYPWQLPLGNSLALPFLTLMIIVFCGLRYPGLIPSFLVFLSGLGCDLFTRSPLGFWSLLFLLALATTHPVNSLIESRFVGKHLKPPLIWLFFCIILALSVIFVWGLASLYQSEWQKLSLALKGGAAALVLSPLPLFLLLGFEKNMILKEQNPTAAAYQPGAR